MEASSNSQKKVARKQRTILLMTNKFKIIVDPRTFITFLISKFDCCIKITEMSIRTENLIFERLKKNLLLPGTMFVLKILKLTLLNSNKKNYFISYLGTVPKEKKMIFLFVQQ